MDTLRIILIILGLIVIALIYLWERHKNKINLDKQVVHISDEDDEPGVMISIRKDIDDNLATDLADLREFMNERDSPVPEFDTDGDRITGITHDRSKGDEHTDNDSAGDLSEQKIVTLHLIARDGDVITGADLLKSAEIHGFKFGEMNIFHYQSITGSEPPAPLFCLVNMYEPGIFDLDTMDTFRTRGVSLFTVPGGGKDPLQAFEEMLKTGRKLAEDLDAQLCGPDRQALDNKTINKIRHSLGRDG